jgi:hypothetical protein
MAQGLQIRDGSGNITFDFTDRTTLILGELYKPSGSGMVEVYDDRLYLGNSFYIIFNANSITFDLIHISGNRVWVDIYDPSGAGPFTNFSCNIMYGIY